MNPLNPELFGSPAILIIDDDHGIWKSLGSLLRFFRSDVNLVFYDDSRAALHYLAEKKVDLIFTDLQGDRIMPFAIFREAIGRTINSSTPIVRMSGMPSLRDVDHQGSIDFLEKPLSIDRIGMLADQYLLDEEIA